MNSEAGRNVALGLTILLRGASCLIEARQLDRDPDETGASDVRQVLFSHEYWIAPFGTLSELRKGLNRRVVHLGGNALGDDLERLLNWLEAPRQMEQQRWSPENCRQLQTKILTPALEACCRMSAGNLP